VDGARWLQHEFDQLHTVEGVRGFIDNWRLMFEGHMVEEHVYTAAEIVAMVGERDRSEGYTGTRYLYDYANRVPEERRNYRTGEMETRMVARKYEITYGDLRAAGYSTEIVDVKNDEGEPIGFRLTRPLPARENPYARYLFGLSGLGTLGEKANDPAVRKAIRANKLVRVITRQGSVHEKHVPVAGQLEREGDAAWEKVGVKRKAGGGGKPWVRHFDGVHRSGGPELPASVSGDDVREMFGFRGVQYGTWVEQEARAEHVRHAYGALVDLADVMGIEPRAIAHGGKLGLSFGARGTGWANAHYEPGEVVINLTHTRGAGSFAHEWAHFFDHQLTANPTDWISVGNDMRRKRSPMVSHGEHAGLPAEVSAAFHHVMDVMHTGDDSPEYAALSARVRRANDEIRSTRRWTADHHAVQRELHAYNARKPRHLREGSKYRRDAGHLGAAYWASPHEMFARAFESYLEDELQARGRQNTYLVSGTQTQYKLERGDAKDLEPYPQGEERQKINGAMRKLVEAMARSGALRKALQRLADLRAMVEAEAGA